MTSAFEVLLELDITADVDCAASNTGVVVDVVVVVVVDGALAVVVVVDLLVLASKVVTNTNRERDISQCFVQL